MKPNNKLLISSSARETIRESVILAEELDTGIEISRVPLYKNSQMSVDETIEILKKDLNDFKNKITLHAMFSDINISSADCLIKQLAQKRCYQSFEIGKGIKADTILFHTGYKGTKHYGSIESFKKNFISFWKEFIKEFEKENIIAVIENVFETSPKFCFELYEQIDSQNLKLALDMGHVNLYAKDTDVIDWIDEYAEGLQHIHIHNNYKTNDDHFSLDKGTLDYIKILTHLKDKNINPSYVLEMFTEEDIRKSIELFTKIYK